MDLIRNQYKYPEVKQLLYSIVEYMKSDKFMPETKIELSNLKSFILN